MAYPSGRSNIISNRWCWLLSGKGTILLKGDAVKCPPDVPHWHGASSDTKFIQVAITGREKGETKWLEGVTDKEYESEPSI